MAKPNLKAISGPKKVKKKAVRAKKHTIKLVDEPRLMMPNDIALIRALTWYKDVGAKPDQSRDWLVAWMDENRYSKADIQVVHSHGRKLVPTFCALARMLTNGSILDEATIGKVHKYVKAFVISRSGTSALDEIDDDGNLISTSGDALIDALGGAPVKKSAPIDPASNVVFLKGNHAAIAKAELALEPLLHVVEAGYETAKSGKKVVGVFEELQKLDITPSQAEQIKAEWKRTADELRELNGRKVDPQLIEGYDHLTKKARWHLLKFFDSLFTQLTSVKIVRKTAAVKRARVVKAKKPDQVVKWLKYQKEESDLGLTSIDPIKVLGANTLWIFNTKTKQVGFYTAKDETGLSVKGTSVINATGKFKKLRNAPGTIAGFTSGTKASVMNKFVAVKAVDTAGNGRINENMILLKVF